MKASVLPFLQSFSLDKHQPYLFDALKQLNTLLIPYLMDLYLYWHLAHIASCMLTSTHISRILLFAVQTLSTFFLAYFLFLTFK